MYKQFATLLECVLSEASTAFAAIPPSNPGASEVIKYLHSSRFGANQSMSHDLEFEQVDKLSFSEIKQSSGGKYGGAVIWILILGANGTAGVRYNASSGYELVMFGKGTEDSLKRSIVRDSTTLQRDIKAGIGKAQQFYVARETSNYPGAIRAARAKNNAGTSGNNPYGDPGPDQRDAAKDALLKKFKPFWIKILQQSIADIKGVANMMVQNGAWQRAQKKLEHAEKLQTLLDRVQDGQMPGELGSAIQSALVMTASHYYPDITGVISNRYGEVHSERSGGQVQVIADINAGDRIKLKTILGFLKRSMVTAQ